MTILDSIPTLECRFNEPMDKHTSFKIGGRISAMLYPSETDELIESCELLHCAGIKPLIIGRGTNMLVSDTALDMVAINMTGKPFIKRNTKRTEVSAYCGTPLATIAEFACKAGLTGFEFAHGIPGTLGGAIVMNAGAYGGEICDVIQSTTAYNPHTGKFTVTGGEHEFSYRHSRFTGTGDIALYSVIRLREGDKKAIREQMDKYAAQRRRSQPLDIASAGSTFKRPKEGYAAELIEQAGLKGFRIGGALVSRKHAGFVVNRGDATFSDVMAVINAVIETVLKQFGIELEPEVRIIRSEY